MDRESSFFYSFLEPISKELALLAKELENSIFTSPRTMLTHSRVFIENILEQVIMKEQLPDEPRTSLKERLDWLNEKGYLIPDIRDAFHKVRRIGNQAAHDARRFRYSEALLSWEALYEIVKWYVEVYGPVEVIVPDYQDPAPQMEHGYDMGELEVRLKSLEELLKVPLQQTSGTQEFEEVAVTVEALSMIETKEIPGFTSVRTLSFRGQMLDVPYFLRDTFLLPQRFDKSETYLIRLGAEQQARIMSELPKNLEGLHKFVKRYSEKNTEIFFKELKTFIEEEKARRQLTINTPGELFFFYKDKHIIVTEELSKVPLTSKEFTGIPSLLRQLNANQVEVVGQLPKELVVLAKYENVGVGTVEKLFEQLKNKVETTQVISNREEITQETHRANKKWESLFLNVKHNDGITVIRGESVPAIWKEALTWIEAQNLHLHEFVKEGIILGSTDNGNRYAIALNPVHKNNRSFAQMHTYKSSLTGDIYYLETKINPRSGLETLRKIFGMLGVQVSIPLLDELSE
ncbi:DUF4145 domain-containing protein [Mesobacillus maritimus]|uniref:DUF4145 domain-containing protein n=1 Tax=Mesobacillus maritimus TaxID=1643336 RepID=UPI001FE5C34C|nr:DUF4145 domain-containing protein [Mesobacillus maritimus]